MIITTQRKERTCCVFILNVYGAAIVILKYLLTIESTISALLSSTITYLLYCYHANWEE
jgi:hypothetical protein